MVNEKWVSSWACVFEYYPFQIWFMLRQRFYSDMFCEYFDSVWLRLTIITSKVLFCSAHGFNGIFNPFVYLYFELRYIRNKRNIHLSLRPEYWIVTLSLHDIVIAIIDIDMSSFYFAFLIFQNKDFVIQYINSLRLEWVGNLRLLLTQPFSLIKFKSTCMIHLALV